MEPVPLIKALTRAVAIVAFWVVLLLSMLLADNLNIEVLLFILLKSMLVSAVLWIFLAIVIDAILKAMIADAREKKIERLDGGLSYHLAEPTKDELEWQKAHADEITGNGKK